jgi:hypothetical protein
MPKQIIASALLLAGAVALAAAVAAFPALRRVYLCLFFLSNTQYLHINFVSMEEYRGWVRGFEVTSTDVFLLGLLAAIVFGWGKHPPRLFPPVFVAMLVYLALVIISATTAFVPIYAAFGVLKFLRYTLALWVVANSVWDEEDLAWLFPTFLACVGYEAFISLKMYVGGVYRARGTFDHSNTLGMYLNMLLPIVFSVLLNLKTQWTAAYLGLFGVGAGVVVLTLSRGSWVALGLSLAIVTPVSFLIRARPKKFMLIGVMVLLAIPPGGVAVQKMIKRIKEAPESSGEARVTFNMVARQMARDRTFGAGINNYSYGSDGPYSDPFEGGLDKGGLCHNLYYLTVGELGWAGLAALLLLHGTIYGTLLSFLIKNHGEDVRTIFALGWLGGMATVSLQSTLEWAMVQTAMSFTFLGLAGVAASLGRIRPEKGATRWTVRIRNVPVSAAPQEAPRMALAGR